MPIPLFCSCHARRDEAYALAQRFGLLMVERRPAAADWLELTENRLALLRADTRTAVSVEWVNGAMGYRRRRVGQAEALARAIGVTAHSLPLVVDATAGLGRDAFVLASLGCQVILLERSPVAAALLSDGWTRAWHEPATHSVTNRMQIIHADALDWLAKKQSILPPDVIYLDPMYPTSKKSAAPKKEMQAFARIIGNDQDSTRLLEMALTIATKRVVVKRPRLGPTLTNLAPSARIEGRNTRFDMYSCCIDRVLLKMT